MHLVLFLILIGLLFGLAAAGKRKKSSLNNELDLTKIVIVLSHGRSGSTELCTILSQIVNSSFDGEMFGSTPKEMQKLQNPLEYMQTFLLEKQKQFPGRAVGFKWKPYANTSDYDHVWKWVADHRVKVIYNYRNPLDVLISGTKAHEDGGRYNCHVENKGCIEKQQSIKTTIDIDTLVSDVKALHDQSNAIYRALVDQNFHFIATTYEELNIGSMDKRVKVLQRLIDFVAHGKVVTAKDFDTSKVAYIGHYHQNETVLNYGEVVRTLNGTRYKKFLH